MSLKIIVGLICVNVFSVVLADNLNDQNKRRLKYLYFANGGLIGFFDDGTVSACAKCDLSKVNIEGLKKVDPHTTFKELDNCLITGQSKFCPMGVDTLNMGHQGQGWAIIDYELQLVIEDG